MATYTKSGIGALGALPYISFDKAGLGIVGP